MSTDYKQFSKFYTSLKPEDSDPTVRTFSTTEKKTKTDFYVFAYEIESPTKRDQQDVNQKFKQLLQLPTHPNLIHFVKLFVKKPKNNAMYTYYLISNEKKTKFETLASVLQKGQISSERVRKWFFQIADALSIIHQKGIIHTNLTPKAIMIDNGDNAKLGKFGIGLEKLVDMLHDSEAYIAPEAFDEKKFSTKSDIFGLGAVFMRLIAGRDVDTVGMKRNEMKRLIPAKYTSSIPEVVELILNCLSEDPKDRPSVAQIVAEKEKTRKKEAEKPIRESKELSISEEAGEVSEADEAQDIPLMLLETVSEMKKDTGLELYEEIKKEKAIKKSMVKEAKKPLPKPKRLSTKKKDAKKPSEIQPAIQLMQMQELSAPIMLSSMVPPPSPTGGGLPPPPPTSGVQLPPRPPPPSVGIQPLRGLAKPISISLDEGLEKEVLPSPSVTVKEEKQELEKSIDTTKKLVSEEEDKLLSLVQKDDFLSETQREKYLFDKLDTLASKQESITLSEYPLAKSSLKSSPLSGLSALLFSCWNPPKVVEPERDEGLEKKNSYETLERIGFGYSAQVFLVQSRKDNQKFVMKIFKTGSDADYQQEINALKRLNHESIVGYVDSFDFDDGYGERQKAVVMEYCDRGDMSKLCSRRRRTKRLSEKLLIDYCLQILKGLDYLHKLSFIHRDIKPANIFMKKNQKNTQIKIGDFGFAIQLTNTDKAAMGGTITYMSPEQHAGEVGNEAVDIWAFGTMLLELMTCRARDLKPELVANQHRLTEIWHEEELTKMGYHPKILECLKACLQTDPALRATSKQAYTILYKVKVERLIVLLQSVFRGHLVRRMLKKKKEPPAADMSNKKSENIELSNQTASISKPVHA